MTTERDPALHSLFALANRDLPDDAFVGRVMSRINKQRQRALVAWGCAALVAVVLAWILTGPVLGAVNLVSQILPESLVELDDRKLALLLAPVNSIAAAVGLGFLVLRMAYRKIFA